MRNENIVGMTDLSGKYPTAQKILYNESVINGCIVRSNTAVMTATNSGVVREGLFYIRW